MKNFFEKDVLNHLLFKSQDFLKNSANTDIEPLIKAKQGFIIASLFLKLVLKSPAAFYIQSFNKEIFLKTLMGICKASSEVFSR